MNDKLNIDKTIREKLNDFSVAPPSHVWDNIQGQMAAQQRKKRLAYVSWIAAAAVVVFAFIAGWVLNQRADTLLPETVEQQMVQTDDEEKVASDKTVIVKPLVEESFAVESKAIASFAPKNETKTVAGKSVVSTEIESSSFVALAEKISYDLLERIEAVFKIEESDVLLAEYNQQPTEFGISAFDEMLIAENIRRTKKQGNNENGWIIGTLVSPGYASHSSSHSEPYAQNMTYSGSNGSANVGAGFSVQYKTTKRLRVESGIYYSQNGQSSNNSGQELFGFNNRADYMSAAPEVVADVTTGFSNTIQLNSNGISMNSTAGVINMRAAPEGVMVATSAEAVDAETANTLTTSGEFSQVFQFVEVPLYVRYNVLDKRFAIEVLGGINAGMVVGNNAYIDNEYGKQNIGNTDDISTMNLSGTFGVGVSYALGKHFSLALEPRLNYFLNSINSNPDVDFRPYRVGVFTGVYYEF